MTSTLERAALDTGTDGARTSAEAWLLAHAPVLLAGLVVAMRLPSVAAAPGADEAGFLMVARQWHSGGTSLYGSYWVDRPPLLISMFRLAAQLGGLVPLRVIGSVAAALVVLGAARVAGQVVAARGSGPTASARAATWAAVVAAALCLSPLMGSTEVNGELLAAPFVVWGLSALLAALRPHASLTTRALHAVAAGAAAACAVLVKQNFVDVAVFAATALLVALARRELTPGQAARIGAGFAAGAAGCVTVVAGWTLLHGTSLSGVYDAMYPFRLQAAKAIAASGNPAPAARLGGMLLRLVLTTVPVLVAIAARALGTRRIRDTAVWALVAMLVFDVASIYLGGNYWSHYLVQLIVPTAVIGGLVAGSRQPGSRLAVAAVVVSSVLGWSFGMPSGASEGSTVGHAVAAAAQPGDTIITIYGHSDVSETSGLASPYPYLWSLPLKVRDPHEHLLDQTLAGTDAPTWLVVWSGVRSSGVDATATQRLVDDHYRPVSVLNGHTVYLHDGVARAAPAPTH